MINVKLPARGPLAFLGTSFPFLFAVLAILPLLGLISGHHTEPGWLSAANSAAAAEALAIYLAPSGYMKWALVAVPAPGVAAAAIVGWDPVGTAIVLGAAAGAAGGFLLRAMMLWALDQREAILAWNKADQEDPQD